MDLTPDLSPPAAGNLPRSGPSGGWKGALRQKTAAFGSRRAWSLDPAFLVISVTVLWNESRLVVIKKVGSFCLLVLQFEEWRSGSNCFWFGGC